LCPGHGRYDFERLRAVLFRLDDFFRGTFAPFFRASESPMATACFRLFTFPPAPPFPRVSVPFFRRRMALSTLLLAALPYFRPPLRDEDFFAAMEPPLKCDSLYCSPGRAGPDVTKNPTAGRAKGAGSGVHITAGALPAG
jgi:hypothetical protein